MNRPPAVRSTDRIANQREVAQGVIDAIDAAEKAAEAIWAAIDRANHLGVAVPGHADLMRVRSLCAQLASEHSTARVLAAAELGLTTKKGA